MHLFAGHAWMMKRWQRLTKTSVAEADTNLTTFKMVKDRYRAQGMQASAAPIAPPKNAGASKA